MAILITSKIARKGFSMFYILRIIICGLIWLFLADKKRWRELLPVGFLAGFIGSTTDNIMHHYELWSYHENKVHAIIPELTDDWLVYMVATYLFIQWLPQERKLISLLKYWFVWTGVAVGIEVIHTITDHMEYHKWWNLGHSYLMDWILFWVFYKFHEIFKLHELSGENNILQSALENMEDVVFILDTEGRIIQAYGSWYEKHGISTQYVIGKNAKELSTKHYQVHNQVREKALSGQNVVYRCLWELPNGEMHWMENSISPIRNSKGEIIGIVGVGREIQQYQYSMNMINTNLLPQGSI